MEYLVTIGLEVHAQILTKSKMFCGCSAEVAGAAPNTHVCPTCMGLPGALPFINRRAVELAARTGLALNCRIQHSNVISRKNYFYPDLPSSYQRSQFDDPLCVAGWVEIEGDHGPKRVGLTRVHIEEDTGKLNHQPDGSSLVDFNRAGVPLMEIVSDPDIGSPEEARRYFQKLQQILRWIGVNTGNMEEGALRCDANVSVRPPGQQEYGAKVEIKNMNSFRAVERALAYEIERQSKALAAGELIRQSTRGWDEDAGKTIEQRLKEGSEDYRYFPEPDLPPLLLTDTWVAERQAELPELPDARRARFMHEYGLSANDAEVLTVARADAEYFEQAVAAAQSRGVAAREVANWITGELFRLTKETGESLGTIHDRFKPEYVGALIALLAQGTITRTSAKAVFEGSFRTGAAPAELVQARGLAVIGGGEALAAMARAAIAANPKSVADYKSGKIVAIKFLVGQVMKASQGQANPQAAQAALEEELNK
ncbi:MAG: Asp-tRNA(Asn)/Glu-tRNA(Gln) amidotransferase subunit GatB [Kouleothrix sp.]|jgi:aspartyl-tRNA(Asn)/glutamyl-tRNA(Gln) amidotransferase subunit B|nr:Asp-tRNA(Asn)/Glu-tRNA(Gln) amidotransferase subunit GatB [Kouleothrix sp.]